MRTQHSLSWTLAGPAGTMYMTSRFQFIQVATHLVMVGEQLTTHPYRIIPLDGRPHIGDILMWNGDPRGHWEGDTLVVDVIHFTDRTWFDRPRCRDTFRSNTSGE